MANSRDVPALIRELRQGLEMTQEKLASRLGVSLPTINRWEKGKTKPDTLGLQALERFVQQLGSNYRDLYERHFSAEHNAVAPVGATPRALSPITLLVVGL